VTKEKATPIRHPFGIPCVARRVRLPHKLARSATRPRAQTYSSEFPDPPPLLGGGTGEGKPNSKTKPPTRRWAQSAHLLKKTAWALVPTLLCFWISFPCAPPRYFANKRRF